MFGYTISIVTNENKFYEICKTLETRLNMTNKNKEKMHEDVDGTLIQIYKVLGKKIKVVNDYEVDGFEQLSENEQMSFFYKLLDENTEI